MSDLDVPCGALTLPSDTLESWAYWIPGLIDEKLLRLSCLILVFMKSFEAINLIITSIMFYNFILSEFLHTHTHTHNTSFYFFSTAKPWWVKSLNWLLHSVSCILRIITKQGLVKIRIEELLDNCKASRLDTRLHEHTYWFGE